MPATPGLIEKINTLSPERVAQVEDFVDFIRHRVGEGTLSQATVAASAPASEAVRNNPKDGASDGGIRPLLT